MTPLCTPSLSVPLPYLADRAFDFKDSSLLSVPILGSSFFWDADMHSIFSSREKRSLLLHCLPTFRTITDE